MRAGLLATVPLPKTVTFRVGAAWAAKTDDALPVQIAEAAMSPKIVARPSMATTLARNH